MGAERSMRECLQEEVNHIVQALPGAMTFAEWYDDGMPFDVFDFGDDVQREAVSYATGYLQGAADLAEQTILTMLDEHGVLMNQPKPNHKRASRRKAKP